MFTLRENPRQSVHTCSFSRDAAPSAWLKSMPITALEIAGRDDEEKMLSRRSGGGGCWRCLSSFVSVALLLASGAALGAGGVLVAQYYTHEDLTLVVLQLYKKERASPLLPVPLPWSRGGSPAPNTSLPGSSTSLPGANASLAVRGSAFADYSVAVTIGGQSFQVIVDTGSSVFAVAASSIDHCSPYYEGACDGATLPTQVYGSGTWDGRVCSGASVKMGGLRAGEPPFAGMLSEVSLFPAACSLQPAPTKRDRPRGDRKKGTLPSYYPLDRPCTYRPYPTYRQVQVTDPTYLLVPSSGLACRSLKRPLT